MNQIKQDQTWIRIQRGKSRKNQWRAGKMHRKRQKKTWSI